MAGKISVAPASLTFDVADGESVFDAAQRHGVRWPSICLGEAECGQCYMIVVSGAGALSRCDPDEAARLAASSRSDDPHARLACRTFLYGDVSVFRRGVRWLGATG